MLLKLIHTAVYNWLCSLKRLIIYIYIYTYIFIYLLLTDDYNRVVLEPLDDTPDSDYINASYVDVSKLCLC